MSASTGITTDADKGTPLVGDPEAEEGEAEVDEAEVMAAGIPTDKKNFHRMIRLSGLPCLRRRRVQMNSTRTFGATSIILEHDIPRNLKVSHKVHIQVLADQLRNAKPKYQLHALQNWLFLLYHNIYPARA